MENDLFHFTNHIFMVNSDQNNEVTIEIELKELLEENSKITILLDYDGTPMKEIILRRRNND